MLAKLYNKLVLILYSLHKGIFIGKNTTFRNKFFLHVGQEGTIQIGENCFFNHGFSAYAYSQIKIGNNCIFGENVKIYDHNHRFCDAHKLIKDQGFNIQSVSIGDNVWVGTNAVILKGARIGNNCVIGAGVVVNGVIPDNSVVKAGKPIIEEIRYGE